MFWSNFITIFEHLSSDCIRNITGIIIQVDVTMMGFVLATLAILASISNEKLIVNMKKTGHYMSLLRRLFICLGTYGCVILVEIFILFLPDLTVFHIPYIVIGLNILTSLLVFDVSHKFWKVLKFLNK